MYTMYGTSLTTIGQVFCAFVAILGVWAVVRRKPKVSSYAQIIVLGELGHSPRMQYHACSMLKHTSLRVELIGYPGSQLVQNLRSNPKVSVKFLSPFKSVLPIPYILYAALKVFFEGLQLFLHLLLSPRPQFLLVQSPPAVPTLAVCFLTCLLRDVPFIVDFHNLGYTLMRPGSLATLYMKIEKNFARRCALGICVSEAMRKFLVTAWGLPCEVLVLYDRPGPQFTGRLPEQAKQEFFTRLHMQASSFDLLAVSATSWTADEDFPMLLDAMTLLAASPLRFLFFITGKGGQRAAFERDFAARKFANIVLRTGWLETADYPKLLGAADVGISMHASSSGLDLPMKVVDMLGAELPVLALKFPAISELLDHRQVFSSAEELAAGLLRLCDDVGLRETQSHAAKQWRKLDFQTHWKNVVLEKITLFL